MLYGTLPTCVISGHLPPIMYNYLLFAGLTSSNALELLRSCNFRIVSNWSNLGATLGVSLEDRKRLRTQALMTGDYNVCLEECLDLWLKNSDGIPSWEQLFLAVEREEKVTAKKMREQYELWK